MKVLLNFTDKSGKIETALQKLLPEIEVIRTITSKQLLQIISGPDPIDVVVVRKTSEIFEDDWQFLLKIRDNKQRNCRIVYLRADHEQLSKEQHEQLYKSGLYGLFYLSGGEAAKEVARAIIEDRSLAETRKIYGLGRLVQPVSAKQNFSVASLEAAKVALEYLMDSYTGVSMESRFEEIISSMPQEQKVDFALTLPDYIRMELDGTAVYDALTKEHKKKCFFRYVPKLSGKFLYLEEASYLDVADKCSNQAHISNKAPLKSIQKAADHSTLPGMCVTNGKIEGALEWVVMQEATCETEGLRVLAHTKGEPETESIPPLGHKEGEWQEDMKADCTKTGKKVLYCKRCGKIIREIEIKPLGHQYGAEQCEPATCNKPGGIFRVCERCNHIEYKKKRPATNRHEFGEVMVLKEPTLDEEGLTGFVCKTCKAQRIKGIIPKLVPVKEEKKEPIYAGEVQDQSVILPCPLCNQMVETHQITLEPTCTNEGKGEASCIACKQPYYWSILKCAHRFEEWEMDPTNCLKDVRVCEVCAQKEYKDSATAHHQYGEKTFIRIAPTCFCSGVECVTCEICGDTMDMKELPVAAHNFDQWQQIKAPTCITEGEEERKCINDGCTYHEIRKLPVTEHVLSEWVIEIKPSCKQCGRLKRHCKVEGCRYQEITERPALRHEYGDWKTVKEATCTAPGTASRTCNVCGHMEEKELPMTKHRLSEWRVLEEARCNIPGKLIRSCQENGCEYAELEEIPALAHQFGDIFVLRQPTCKEPGLMAKRCSLCGEEQIVEELPKTGHSYGKPVVLEAESCTKKGYSRQYCIYCNKEIERTKPALGHAYSKNDEGLYVCVRCGKTKKNTKSILAACALMMAVCVIFALIGAVIHARDTGSKETLQFELAMSQQEYVAEATTEECVATEQTALEVTEQISETEQIDQTQPKDTTIAQSSFEPVSDLEEDTAPAQIEMTSTEEKTEAPETVPKTVALETETTSVRSQTTADETQIVSTMPTTAAPITEAATTQAPTTEAPTTAVPTSVVQTTSAPTTCASTTVSAEEIEDFTYMVGDIYTGEEIKAFISAHRVCVMVITREGIKYSFNGDGDTAGIASDASFSCNIGSYAIVFSQF